MNVLLLLQTSQTGNFLQSIAQLVADHKGSIYLLSCLTSLFFAIAMFAPFRRDATEKWAKYFGAAFAVTSIQYGVRFTLLVLGKYELIDEQIAEGIKHVFVALSSAGNNLLFFIAALHLLGTKSKSRLEVIAVAIAIFSLVSILELFGGSGLLSLPDTIFSAVCLTLIGYATATNMFYRKFPLLAAFAILVGAFYGFLNIVYGFNPIIFHSPLVNRFIPLESLFVTPETLQLFLMALAFPLKFGLFLPGYVLHQRGLNAFYDIQDMLKGMIDGREEFISHDGIVKVIGQRFKGDLVDLSIKLPGKRRERVASILWESIPPEDHKKVTVVKKLRNPRATVADERKLLTETGGFAEKNLFAEAVIKWGLNRSEPFLYPETKSSLAIASRKICRKIFSLIGISRNSEIHTSDIPDAVQTELKDKKAMMLIPIKFHGVTVGCIKIERNKPSYILGKYKLYLPFSSSGLSLAKQIADLAAPSVQAYRELATLDKLSLEFAQALSEATAKTSGELYDFQEAGNTLADILQDALSPEAMRLVIDFGFMSMEPVDRGEDKFVELLQRKLGDKNYDDLPKYMEGVGGNCFKLYKRELYARVTKKEVKNTSPQARQAREDVQFRLGYLVLAVRTPKDKFDKPVLGANYLHRKAVASILSDAILDFGRAYLSRQLRSLSTSLNQEQRLEVERWYQDIKKTAEASGLLWLVTNRQDEELIGSAEGKELVKHLPEETVPESTAGESQSEVRIHHYKITPPVDKTHHIIRLDLPNSEYQLWLGVGRAGFEHELSFASPWQTFLNSYGEIAGAGLVRFTAVQEFQKLQIEAAQYQGLATVAVTMGTLAHQLTNMARNQAVACSALENILDVGVLKVGDGQTSKVTSSDVSDLIHSMKQSADQHMHLLEAFTQVTKVDDRRPCSLLEAVQQAATLFQTALLQNEITVEIAVDPDFKIDLPFYVAALAVGNLISNAKDAMTLDMISSGKKIFIKAYENDGGISCEVRDEGKGIDPRLAPHIFKLGVTTKPYSGGWGLYLVKRSLLENGADIVLTEPGSNGDGATFSIWFPSPMANSVAAD
jgi:signal transduction histidine kinase